MLSGNFCDSEIRHGIFWGLNFGPGIFWALIFAPIRSSQSPEIHSTPPGISIEAISGQENIYVAKCEQFMPSPSKNYYLLVASYNSLL